jgi:hypothetical protein
VTTVTPSWKKQNSGKTSHCQDPAGIKGGRKIDKAQQIFMTMKLFSTILQWLTLNIHTHKTDPVAKTYK